MLRRIIFMVNITSLKGVERAFMQLHEIASNWRNPLERDYYVACVTDTDGVRKFCYLSEPVVDYVFGNRITVRKRFIVPVKEVFREANKNKEDSSTASLLAEIKPKLLEVVRKGLGPATNWKSAFGSHSSYRALCAFAENLS